MTTPGPAGPDPDGEKPPDGTDVGDSADGPVGEKPADGTQVGDSGDGPVGEKPADGTEVGDSAERPVGEKPADDLNWPIPMLSIVPLSALFVVAMVVAFGADRVLVAVVPFVVLLAAITVIDLRELRVPNRLVQPAALVAVPLLAIAATSAWPDVSLGRALVAGLAMGLAYFGLALIHPAGMGLGDVKLSPIIGAQLGLFGWVPTVRGLLLAFLLVGPVALVLLALRKARVGTGLPFAPFMAIGAIAALMLEGLT